jgi:hypothetical protein
VSDIERPKDYRGILGLQVVYDETADIFGRDLPMGVLGANAGRLVFLKSHEDHMVGVLGLYCYADIPMPKPQAPRNTVVSGDSVIVINTTECNSRMARIKSFANALVEKDAVVKTYKTVSGHPVKVLTIAFFGPDGHFIELNEILEGSV